MGSESLKSIWTSGDDSGGACEPVGKRGCECVF